MAIELEYPINRKKSVFNAIKNDTIRLFLPPGCFTEIIVANPNSTSPLKFSACCSLKVTFLFLFVSLAELQQPFVIVHPGLASIFKITTALHAVYTATLTYHVKFELVAIFSRHFSRSKSKKPNSQTKYISLLAFLRKWTLTTVTLKVAYQEATKDEKWFYINFPKIEYKPYLSSYYSSTKENDSVRMVFPENSSRLYLRTALRLYGVTKSYGLLENHSKP